MSEVLTVRDALALAEIIMMASRTDKVARIDKRTETDVIYGVARSVGDRDFGFLGVDDDVREGYLRVTTRSGLEVAWPVSELIEDYKDQLFARYDWS